MDVMSSSSPIIRSFGPFCASSSASTLKPLSKTFAEAPDSTLKCCGYVQSIRWPVWTEASSSLQKSALWLIHNSFLKNWKLEDLCIKWELYHAHCQACCCCCCCCHWETQTRMLFTLFNLLCHFFFRHSSKAFLVFASLVVSLSDWALQNTNHQIYKFCQCFLQQCHPAFSLRLCTIFGVWCWTTARPIAPRRLARRTHLCNKHTEPHVTT